MWRQTRVAFGKEWRDALRDRRSLMSALAYSVVGPLLVAMILLAMARTADRDTTLRLVVDGAERAPSLVSFLEQRRVRVVAPPQNVERALRDRDVDIALLIPDDFAQRFSAVRPAGVYVAYDSSRSAARWALPRVRALLEEYSIETAAARLVLRGVAPAVARPLQVRERDVSTAASRAAIALAALPIFLLLAPFISSMNLAIDVTAGERERGSLEPLLAHPVGHAALAFGKWMPGVILSFCGAALTLAIIQLVLRSGRLQALDAAVGFAWADTGAVLTILLPLAFLAPAVQMLAAMFSRSYKEAQTYLSLLLFLPMIPGFLFGFEAWRPEGWMAAVPVVGQHLLLERVMRGEPLNPGAWGLLALGTLCLGVACVAVTARLIGDEGIVFGR